jgi:hypothetical protein
MGQQTANFARCDWAEKEWRRTLEAQDVMSIKRQRERSFTQNVSTNQDIKPKSMMHKFTALDEMGIQLSVGVC